MNRFRNCMVALVVFSLAAAGLAEQKKTKPVLRLAIELTDGSHIVGVPLITSVPVQTSYAKMDIPLKRIAFINVNDDHETASIELQNCDKIKGVLNMAPIKLTTIFGKTAIDIKHITSINVLRSGSSADLVLHYSFDKDESGKVLDNSGRQHHGILAGHVPYKESIKGKGIKTSSKDTYVVCSSPDLTMDGWRQVTVSAWVKLSQYATYGNLINRGKENTGSCLSISVGGVYGGKPYGCGFSVNFGEKVSASVRIDRFADLNQWYHVAGVYDGRSVKYYANGKEIGSTDLPDELKGKPIKEENGSDLIIGKSATHRSWLDTHINGTIDEVKIFKRALSANEIKQMYNSMRHK